MNRLSVSFYTILIRPAGRALRIGEGKDTWRENKLTSVIGVTENGNISVLNCDQSHRSGGSGVVYESVHLAVYCTAVR